MGKNRKILSRYKKWKRGNEEERERRGSAKGEDLLFRHKTIMAVQYYLAVIIFLKILRENITFGHSTLGF